MNPRALTITLLGLALLGTLLALTILGTVGACGPESAPPEVEINRGGLSLRAPGGITRATLSRPDGTPILTRRAPAPLERLDIQHPWAQGGPYLLDTLVGGEAFSQAIDVPSDLPPFVATLQAPIGEGESPINDGDEFPILMVGDGDKNPGRTPVVQGAVTLRAFIAGDYAIELGSERVAKALSPGETLLAMAPIRSAVTLKLTGPDHSIQAKATPLVIPINEARALIDVASVDFPVEAGGSLDLARPRDRIQLPAPWWQAILDETNLGFRPRNIEAPWGHQGITLTNQGSRPLNLAIEAKVLGPDGQQAEAFTPWLRRGDDGSGRVRALLRVPPGESAQAVLPLFLRESTLPEDLPPAFTRQLKVVPLGQSTPLLIWEGPLYVTQGSTAESLGLFGAVLAALIGAIFIALRITAWLRAAPTSELMAIALFGTLTFIVSAGGRLLAMGVAAGLGPFGIFITALIDETLRYTLLGTLVLLYPRRGTAALAILVDWLLSGFALGTFGPSDLLLVGGRVLWLELALMAFGVTRGNLAHRPWGRLAWARLGGAFATASVISSATGVILQVTLYRLYLADWYVALILLLPGFVYVLIGVAFALPFARSLREVAR